MNLRIIKTIWKICNDFNIIIINIFKCVGFPKSAARSNIRKDSNKKKEKFLIGCLLSHLLMINKSQNMN